MHFSESLFRLVPPFSLLTPTCVHDVSWIEWLCSFEGGPGSAFADPSTVSGTQKLFKNYLIDWINVGVFSIIVWIKSHPLWGPHVLSPFIIQFECQVHGYNHCPVHLNSFAPLLSLCSVKCNSLLPHTCNCAGSTAGENPPQLCWLASLSIHGN